MFVCPRERSRATLSVITPYDLVGGSEPPRVSPHYFPFHYFPYYFLFIMILVSLPLQAPSVKHLLLSRVKSLRRSLHRPTNNTALSLPLPLADSHCASLPISV